MVLTHGGEGAAHPPTGARAGCDKLIPDTVPGAPGMVPLPHCGEDSASSSPDLRVNPCSLIRPFRGCSPWTSLGNPGFKGFTLLLSHLPVQQQPSLSGLSVSWVQEWTLTPS